MTLQKRIEILVQLGQYMQENSEEWQQVKERAYAHNGWFLPEFIDLSVDNIVNSFLQQEALERWVSQYPGLAPEPTSPRLVGIVMAGNIPLVGFHDFLCVFISGHRCLIKPSSKDEVLIKHVVEKMIEWAPELDAYIAFAELLKNCDAYIATGSNSSAGHFEYYFGRFPHIIRRNRTSVAIITGNESKEELEQLANDIYLYFGMGCRNITKIYVPRDYDFESLINIFKKYDYLADHHKYKNNYDYNLALHLLNHNYYMSNASLLLIEADSLFSPVSQLNYEIYENSETVTDALSKNNDVQCIVGNGFTPFGRAQYPALTDYADGVDTMQWLTTLK